MKQLKIYSNKIPYSSSRFFNQYEWLTQDKEYHVILESGRGGRFSIAAFDPDTILIGRHDELVIKQITGEELRQSGNPLHLMKEWMSHFQVETLHDLPDFQGGVIGFISYDYARHIEQLPASAEADLDIPELFFLSFKQLFVFDHEQQCLWLIFLYEDNGSEIESIANKWEELWLEEHEEVSYSPPLKQGEDYLDVSMDEAAFREAVERIQQYISQGDVFQVNLSVRQAKPLAVNAIEVYKQLRVLNPSPYMGYYHTPEFQLVSGSPELLIKKADMEVSTRPIAGTRSRGKSEEEDIKLANELIENEKERAEHVMLVDLERNDLGRVCAYGSVEVNEFMVIEKYSHVMHIVSNVRGTLANNKSGVDLVNATFPGGTITGAPKVRTMEIIEELEPVRRSIYTGSLGWMGFNGDLELNIVIRTMLVKDGKAYVQAGAGIVIDSNPAYEYKESLKKAIALWKAKEMAEMKTGEQS
ncbi:anthranilate synthase component I family protein [Cytobacillus spongiae]|uniref:anthranilate synthase component I family protein n=1 Tax=Cytobacillus spongiae TaxID=2901381 RepID=UPI001F266CC8|nr:anthranilate synthase component I family protein [Cytobacillus spongiae]UII56033.1 anthranilate synthase component I family protein [Cytobacillus spongiae]